MFRRIVLTLVTSACVAACDRSEPSTDAPTSSAADTPRARGSTDGRLPIRVELEVVDADSKSDAEAEKRVSAEIDRAFASHSGSKRVRDDGEWRIDIAAGVIANVDVPRGLAESSSLWLDYEISAVPPAMAYRVDGYERHISSSSRGLVACDLGDLASRFAELIGTIERFERLLPSSLRTGETDLIHDEEIRFPGRRWSSRR